MARVSEETASSLQAMVDAVLAGEKDFSTLTGTLGLARSLTLSNIALALRTGVISHAEAARCLDAMEREERAKADPSGATRNAPTDP